MAAAQRTPPLAILGRFLRFGLLAFGGPVAQIAMLRRELVDEEGWVTSSRFNRLLAVYQALPGPEAHELAVHLGLLRGGRVGALLAGLGFMFPGVVLMLAISWLYFQVDLAQASIGAALLGAQVAVIALVTRAVERIRRHILSGLRAGLLTFGGAYTAIPFIRGDAVGNGWLTDAQFLDGLALGSILPAPLIIFGTFVGYVAGGPLGAVAMTAGIFLPAFSFALLLGDRIERVVDNPALHRLLEGVAAGVVGLIAITALQLAAAGGGRLPALLPGFQIFRASLAVRFAWGSRARVPPSS